MAKVFLSLLFDISDHALPHNNWRAQYMIETYFRKAIMRAIEEDDFFEVNEFGPCVDSADRQLFDENYDSDEAARTCTITISLVRS